MCRGEGWAPAPRALARKKEDPKGTWFCTTRQLVPRSSCVGNDDGAPDSQRNTTCSFSVFAAAFDLHWQMCHTQLSELHKTHKIHKNLTQNPAIHDRYVSHELVVRRARKRSSEPQKNDKAANQCNPQHNNNKNNNKKTQKPKLTTKLHLSRN